jgi:FecR protein
MKRGKIVTWGSAMALAGALSASVLAQDAGTGPPQNPAQNQNPVENPIQSRAVRLSSVEGQVRISQSGQSVTDQAVANTPLFNGFGIQTGDDGRAELQFPSGTIGRVPPDSSVSLDGMANGPGDMILDHGMGYFELRGAERVRFGDYTATAAGAALLRVKLDEAPGELAVFSGNVHLEGQDGINADLHGGQSVRLAPKESMLNVADAIDPDSWDAWNSDRDQVLTAAANSATSATREMPDSANPAWGDLNQNGNWYNVPDEGYVWSPYDASNSSWDPYGNGYWMDSPGYGYTWISGYSWGYLPYQCGLWNWYGGFGWGWAPGSCTPWWGGGGIWIVNVGHFPTGWHPPLRPIPHPHGPPGSPRPGGGVRAVGPQPVITVHRQGPPVETGLPLRDRHTPVAIAGATVEPMRPVAVRPVYNHLPARSPMQFNGTSSGGIGTGTAIPGTVNRPGFTPVPVNPVYNTGPAGASHARPAPGGIKSAPVSHPAPAPAPRAAPPPPPAAHPR